MTHRFRNHSMPLEGKGTKSKVHSTCLSCDSDCEINTHAPLYVSNLLIDNWLLPLSLLLCPLSYLMQSLTFLISTTLAACLSLYDRWLHDCDLEIGQWRDSVWSLTKRKGKVQSPSAILLITALVTWLTAGQLAPICPWSTSICHGQVVWLSRTNEWSVKDKWWPIRHDST
jgi:hypothetical protein